MLKCFSHVCHTVYSARTILLLHQWLSNFDLVVSIIIFVLNKILLLNTLAEASLYEVGDEVTGILFASLSLFCSSVPETPSKEMNE